MDHLILNNGSDGAALAEVALKALREARNSKTSSSGSIFVSDGQTDADGIALGTGTIINGVDGGIQPWVGDTTPPGKPTGLSVSSKNAAVIVNWDGSMEGGKPVDWGHLQLLATDDKGNNYDFGVLYGAGSQQLADLTPGAKLTVWAVGYDDAHDADGNSTPNASTPSDNLTVTVESAVDPKDLQQAQDDAQSALDKAGQAVDTATASKSAADSASAVATQAQATATAANQSATSAQTAANLALANAQELVVNGGFETGDLTSWTGSGWSISSSTSRSGSYSLTTTSNKELINTAEITAITGRTLRFSFYAKSDGSTGGFYKRLLGWNGIWWEIISVDNSQNALGPEWTLQSFDYTCDGKYPKLRFRTIPYNNDLNTLWVDDVSVKDITETQAAQKAADDAQATADNAQVAADNAKALANAAQAAAQGAQTTADGKNKIFSSATQPSSTGLVPGDLWFQLDSSSHVRGIQVWNGSVFVDYVLMANQILVAGSVGTTQIADNAIVTGKIAANSVTSVAIASHTITTDNIMAGQFQGYVFTGSVFQSSEAADTGIKIDSTAVQMWDSAHNKTVYLDGEGKNNVLTGSFQTATTGNRVSINAQATYTLISGSATLSGQSIVFNDDDFARSPQINGLFTNSNLGDAPRLSLLSGWKTDHDPAAMIYLDSWPRSKGATGTGITSEARMSADTDYTEPDSTKTSNAALTLLGVGGSGARARLNAYAYNGSQAEVWVTATRNDGFTQVGVGADAFTRSIYLGGKLGGIVNQRTFQTSNWKILDGDFAAGRSIHATVVLSPAKYGVYHAVASADCGWGSIFIHVDRTGNASQYEVRGYNAGAAYTGNTWVDAIAWLI